MITRVSLEYFVIDCWLTENCNTHIVQYLNQIMKFGQLIGYNIKNIFPEKSYTKRGGETIPRLFSKNSKLNISLDQ